MKKISPYLVDQRVRYRLIYNVLPPVPARICELGVGGGYFVHRLHEEGYDVYGCDVSLKDFPENSPIIGRILHTSGAHLPFPDNHFDATYSCDVLEHVCPNDRQAFLDEIIRITKPGGVVALTAFFHNTFAFRLWGAGYLALRGTLPCWYIEHLTIPLPDEEETFAYLSKSLIDLRRIRYQRALNLFTMWIQSTILRRIYFAWLSEIITGLVLTCDVIGQTTSSFFTGVKLK